MTSENQAVESKKNSEIATRNALIIKIALFMGFLSKANHEKLVRDLSQYEASVAVDALKVIKAKNYISQQDIAQLKKTCLSFAKAQKDTRFGSLCINFGFLTQSNLDLALEEQARLSKNGETIMLGDLLVDAGMISERQRSLVLQKQKLESSGQRTSSEEKPVASAAARKQTMREIKEPEIVILIPDDALSAFIQKTDLFDKNMLISDLKILLEKNGIIYGVVDDDSLENFIEDDAYIEKPFEAAKGLESIDGVDAQIDFMFEQDYLKAGELSEDGTIDFKVRGDIPFVKQGDILAEKIPAKEGKDGINIYGDTIYKLEAEDTPFVLGRGVYLSEDKLRVLAEVEGNPKLKGDGEISVNDAYFIEGDVDYTTGHVKFDKNVFISGTIKSGFRVEAIDVVVGTIDGGIVKAEGNVFVQNGVTESSIEAKGGIKAGFMHRSEVRSMGDVNIIKEIADTKVLTEGTFAMIQGRMFSSNVCAKGGIKVYNIGSEKAKPSTITVGTSIYLEQKLINIDQEIEKRQNHLENQSLEKTKIEAELKEVEEKLVNYEKSKQRTLSMIEKMKESGGKADKQAGQAALFKKSLDEAELKIYELQDRDAKLKARLNKTAHTIERSAEAVKVSVKEKFSLKRMDQKNPPKPIVDVTGKVLAGTRINGRHSNLIINKALSRARIMEMNISGESGSKRGWEMVVTNF